MQEFYEQDFQFLYNDCFTEHDRGNDGIARFLRITDEGVFYDDCLKEGGESTKSLRWKPVHELAGPNKPSSSGPALPFPFTANQLAAFMLWGWWGSHFQSFFGLLDCGPNEFVLNGDHEDAADAYEALRQAYVIYQDALHVVGELDQQDRQRAYDLLEQAGDAYSQALDRERVMERVIIEKEDGRLELGDFIPRDEYLPRLARAKESVAAQKAQALQAEEQADAKERAWRKSMTRQLLQPQATTPSPAPVSASNSPATARRGLLAPVIEAAQKECEDPFDAPAVWASLVRMADAGKRPLLGVSDEGIKWQDSNDEPQFLNLKNLRDRLSRSKKKAR